MLKKRLLVVLLVVLMLGSTAIGYSYWDNLSQSENEIITIGEGVNLTVTAVAEVPAGATLVPAGVVMKSGDVDEIVLTYNVKLDQEALEALVLDVQSSNVQIGGSSTNSGLVNIDISLAASTVNAADVLVTVTVTLDEPATYEIYSAIANETITFDLTFTASQAV